MSGNRLVFIDEIKGFAILLVVMGHVLAWNGLSTNDGLDYNHQNGSLLFQLIYSFHMPLFFCISGYLYRTCSNFPELIKSIKGKTMRLLFPYLTTGIFIYLCRGNWGYWFLLSLFELLVYFSVMDFIFSKIVKTGLLRSSLTIGIGFFCLKIMSVLVFNKLPVWHGIDLFKFNIYYLPFSLGYIWKNLPKIGDILESEIVYILSIIVFTIIFCSRFTSNNFMVEHMKSIMSLCACICVFQLFVKRNRNRVLTRILSYMGGASLHIYICHIFFICQFPQVGAYISKQSIINSFFLQVIYSIIISIIAIAMSLLCANILCHSKYLSSILFGNKIVK